MHYSKSILFIIFMLGLLANWHLKAQEYRIYFEFDTYQISEKEKQTIEDISNTVDAATLISIEGRAGWSGSEKYNLFLSQLRAVSVKNELLKSGIKNEQILVTHIGKKEADLDKEKPEDRVVIISLRQNVQTENKIIPEKKNDLLLIEIRDIITLDLLGGYVHVKGTGERFEVSPAGIEIEKQENEVLIFSSHGYRDSTVLLKPGENKITLFLIPLSVKEIIRSDNIYFYGGTPEILPESFRAIDYLYIKLKDREDILIEINGHVNWPLPQPRTPEKEKSNQVLSEQRALAVKQQLIKRGISKEIISSAGFGSSRMIFPYALTEGEQAQNRRVEIIVRFK